MKIPKVVTRFVIKIGDKYLASEDFWNPHSKWSDLKLVSNLSEIPESLRFETYEKAKYFLMDCWESHYFLRNTNAKVVHKYYLDFINEVNEK